MSKSRIHPDLLLIGGFLLIGLILLAAVFLTRKTGGNVEISVAGEVTEVYSLDRSGEYTIEGIDGGTNQLKIENGEAWLTDASCPDQLCVGMGKIHYNGESIICLPNQVVIRVTDGETNDEVDFITGGQH